MRSKSVKETNNSRQLIDGCVFMEIIKTKKPQNAASDKILNLYIM